MSTSTTKKEKKKEKFDCKFSYISKSFLMGGEVMVKGREYSVYVS
jgi:hypothetical protein